MYWKRCVTCASSTPGDRPGGCRGLSGSLTQTTSPEASSILPTQLVPLRGSPVTSRPLARAGSSIDLPMVLTSPHRRRRGGLPAVGTAAGAAHVPQRVEGERPSPAQAAQDEEHGSEPGGD